MPQEKIDVVIIGAGVSGLGIGLLCAERGLKPTVVDRSSLCSGASGNSLRIIHGGFRYLQSLDIVRVIRSRRDQARLVQRYGAYISPLRCRMPLHRAGFRSAPFLGAGGALYSVLSGLSGSGFAVGSRIVGTDELERESPLLSDCAPRGAFEWRDYLVSNLSGFHAALANQLRSAGGTVIENTEVHGIARAADGFEIELRSDRGSSTVYARRVVNAAGAWLERARPLGEPGPDVWWCRGFNLQFNRAVTGGFGLAAQSPAGRLFFAVPRGEGSVIGTGYSPATTDVPLIAAPSEQEIAGFITEANQAFPSLKLERSEVTHVDAGVLPCRARGGADPELIASPKIFSRDGYIEVVSTKYTTFLSQAEQVMRLL